MIVHGDYVLTEVQTDAELHSVWGEVREGLNTVSEKCGFVRYMPEDYYHEIKNRKKLLLVARHAENHRFLGFLIVERIQDPDGPGLHIWAFYHVDVGDAIFEQDCGDILGKLGEIAQVKRLSFASTRKGWHKKKFGGFAHVGNIEYFERGL